MSLNGIGTCQISRQRAGKVTSMGRFAFAVEHGTGTPVVTSSQGQILFSEVGAGVYPVAFAGLWTDIVLSMEKYRKTQFNIDPSLRGHTFTLHMSAAVAKYGKAVEIHDGLGDAMVNIVSFAAGLGTGAIGNTFGTNLTNLVSDVGGAAADSFDLFKWFRGTPVKSEKHVAVWFHYLPFKGGVNTGKQRASIGRLFPYAYELVKRIAT